MARTETSNNVLVLLAVGIFSGGVLWYAFPSSEVDLGRSSIVALRAKGAGKYVEVYPNGMLRPTANLSSAQSARFRMITVSTGTVARLREQALLFENASLVAERDGRTSRTRSGCRCSGFSSEHGFGRFCYEWEQAWQDRWCYVDDSCVGKSVKKGSFGRRHDLCTPAPFPSPPPNPPPDPFPPPPPPEYDPKDKSGMWVAPRGCKCTGFSNRHGFGARCEDVQPPATACSQPARPPATAMPPGASRGSARWRAASASGRGAT